MWHLFQGHYIFNCCNDSNVGQLTAHNWQFFFKCISYMSLPYRVEAVGLKSANYTFKITIFVSM